ncbi:MarR family winged helix-turn-helix transcriptional regulator [Vibrio tritonius]|uniref:MarR family winged helix-turn-helix transcriptional regulator n=1 Tax=Vibrio tritonius TaxID=1435069 RepID=A0ABS7YHG0_9VIBR|nr:MarR family winged helix-turn-helix transcriptional regulator [Vibrio tritonius]MCA2014773.1 MarR family winged helix-turn-helix transcriptional regulator [Vibrio tritonius]
MDRNSLEQQIANLTQSLRENISKELIKKEITLTFYQSLVLFRIAEKTPCTAHDVVVSTKKDKAQITRLVNDLIAIGYLDRAPNPKDKRQLLLTLTAAGQECFEEIRAVREKISEKMTRGIPQNQQQEMLRWIQLMENNLAG